MTFNNIIDQRYEVDRLNVYIEGRLKKRNIGKTREKSLVCFSAGLSLRSSR